MDQPPIRVALIAGAGRVGSTLLERLLGQVEGFCAVGEVRQIWLRSFGADQRCGCGRPFSRCPFWRPVVEGAFGDEEGFDPRAVRRLQEDVDHLWLLPSMLTVARSRRFDRRFREYAGIMARLYRSIGTVSGARVVVDSSKTPSHIGVLAAAPGLRLHVIHLVRDSRAVAFSWTRTRLRPEIEWEPRYMPRYGPVRSALEWDAMNASVHALRRVPASYLRVRYEDLVADPAGTLRAIVSLLAPDAHPDLGFVAEGRAVLEANHTVSGNPTRFETGPVEVREDAEWERELRPGHRVLVTALTSPLLAAYGYLGPKAPRSGR